MRLRFGVAMAVKGGRSAIIGAEVREARDEKGRLQYAFQVGSIVRPSGTIEETGEAILGQHHALDRHRPCVMIDTGSPQGAALRKGLRESWPRGRHRPHAYKGVGDRKDLFSAFLLAYSLGRVHIPKGMTHRGALDRALVFYMGSGTKRDGFELESEDEALVVALGLSLVWPLHGPEARRFSLDERAHDAGPVQPSRDERPAEGTDP